MACRIDFNVAYFRSIPMENKGFKMLAKMGWSKGQSLGKRDDGLTEPVSCVYTVLCFCNCIGLIFRLM